jgi:hypothetical protein
MEFDTIQRLEVCDTSQALHYVGAACFAWDMLGDMASFEGTTLHGYGESLFNKWECRRLTWPRHALWRIYTKADIKICVGENRASSILSRA